MRVDRLVSMANDIGAFFNGEPDKTEAARGVASHVRRFWDPRMRKEIVAYVAESGGASLAPPVRKAIESLTAQSG